MPVTVVDHGDLTEHERRQLIAVAAGLGRLPSAFRVERSTRTGSAWARLPGNPSSWLLTSGSTPLDSHDLLISEDHPGPQPEEAS